MRLLNRTTRTLSPTDEGQIACERCRQILEDLDEVDAAMAQRRGRPSATLRLTAPLSFGQRHILPLFDACLEQWPELRADIRFTDRFIDLIDEGLDVAVRIGGTGDDSQLSARTVGWQQFVTCASPEYLSRRGVPGTPRDLAGTIRSLSSVAGDPAPGATRLRKVPACRLQFILFKAWLYQVVTWKRQPKAGVLRFANSSIHPGGGDRAR